MADQLSLVVKRGQIKAQLTRFTSYIERLEKPIRGNAIIEEVKRRLSKTESLLDEFNLVQDQLELLQHDEIASESSDRDDFENKYYSVPATAATLITTHVKPSISVSECISGTQNQIGVKLPTIQLPAFSGNYDKWMEFYDTFNSLIHTNEQISDIQKFHYLRSSLKNEAAAVIQSLEVSAASYTIAWQLLKERFQNKRLIVHNHTTALFDLKPIGKESHVSLRLILDEVLNHLRALASLGQPTDTWDTLLIYLVNSKLDQNTRREWEFYKIADETPTFNEFTSFLRERCDILETINNVNTDLNPQRNINIHKYTNIKSNVKGYLVSNNISCIICKGSHSIYNCKEFLELTTENRIIKIKALKLCSNCLRKGHFLKEGKSSTCRKCQAKHNTLLHLDSVQPVASEQPSSSTMSNHAISNCVSQVLLSTACVKVYDNRGKEYNCRVLLDSGSQSNFITESMCNKLNLKKDTINSSVTGINQSSLPIKFRTITRISSLCNAANFEIPCLVLDKITDQLPSVSFNPSSLNIPSNIRLADPKFYKAATVDMLIGAHLFWTLLSVGQIVLRKNLPMLQKTQFGWVISGSVSISVGRQIHSYCSLETLNSQLKKFWQLEECREKQLSPVDQHCEEVFINTTTRTTDGRFVVQIPFISPTTALGDSKPNAINRQISLERKFARQPKLCNEYVEFMNEYESLGHMSLVHDSSDSLHSFYLPHHAVIKESSVTTKLRVVFDGSAKSTSGISLNDIQGVGPAQQQDILSILLRFRSYQYVTSADVAKMYRQILINPAQRNMQRIVWRKDARQPIQTYTLNTVTYGTASAPFLAMRCLKQLALDNVAAYPQACKLILSDFYVDDLLTGANSETELTNICRDIDSVLKQAGFELRKWTSNNSAVLSAVSQSNHCDATSHSVMIGENSKILGIFWIPSQDILRYNINSVQLAKATKRTILSMIAQIYDPLGLISPVTIIAKIIIQQLWQANLHWDESVPARVFTKWNEFIRQLPSLNTLSIPRYVLCNYQEYIEVHGFCDASSLAYGACVFVRSLNSNGKIAVNLLCAKSKVAPLKIVSIPRLELCGALLLAQLVDRVKTSLSVSVQSYYYWCDSTIALCWIRADPQRWKTFIANRVSSIQTLSNTSDWYHMRSQDNPADLLSRGMLPDEIKKRTLWWSGPSWLNQNKSTWPSQTIESDEIDQGLLESRNTIALITTTFDINLFTKYSSFTKLKRVVAYLFRFTANCKIDVENRQTAESVILKSIQMYCFSSDYSNLQKSKPVNCKGKLLSLHPFLDKQGLIGVGGRLTNSTFDFLKKHPIILPASNTITNLIAREKHHIKRVIANTKLTYEEFNTVLIQIV